MPNYKKLPAQSEHFNGKLYQRMLDDLHLSGKAERTIYGYIREQRKGVRYRTGCLGKFLGSPARADSRL